MSKSDLLHRIENLRTSLAQCNFETEAIVRDIGGRSESQLTALISAIHDVTGLHERFCDTLEDHARELPDNG